MRRLATLRGTFVRYYSDTKWRLQLWLRSVRLVYEATRRLPCLAPCAMPAKGKSPAHALQPIYFALLTLACAVVPEPSRRRRYCRSGSTGTMFRRRLGRARGAHPAREKKPLSLGIA